MLDTTVVPQTSVSVKQEWFFFAFLYHMYHENTLYQLHVLKCTNAQSINSCSKEQEVQIQACLPAFFQSPRVLFIVQLNKGQ